ncbi:hypothetical protein NDU88_002871, partial [Pleurodeles waltl]
GWDSKASDVQFVQVALQNTITDFFQISTENVTSRVDEDRDSGDFLCQEAIQTSCVWTSTSVPDDTEAAEGGVSAVAGTGN